MAVAFCSWHKPANSSPTHMQTRLQSVRDRSRFLLQMLKHWVLQATSGLDLAFLSSPCGLCSKVMQMKMNTYCKSQILCNNSKLAQNNTAMVHAMQE